MLSSRWDMSYEEACPVRTPRQRARRCVSIESRSGGVAAFLREPIAVRHLVSVLSDVLIEQ